jgi:hypothetical protein
MYRILGIAICLAAITQFFFEWHRSRVRSGGRSLSGWLASTIRGIGGIGMGVGFASIPSAAARWLVGIGVGCLLFSAMFELFVVRRRP